MKLARTVIVGENQTLICSLLYLLSYFIRCSEVYEKTETFLDESCDEEDKVEMTPIEEGLSPASSRGSVSGHVTDDVTDMRGGVCDQLRDSGIGLEAKPLDSTCVAHESDAHTTKSYGESDTTESYCDLLTVPTNLYPKLEDDVSASKCTTDTTRHADTTQSYSKSPTNAVGSQSAIDTTHAHRVPDVGTAHAHRVPDIGTAHAHRVPDEEKTAVQCKLSVVSLLSPQMENIQNVRKSSPQLSPEQHSPKSVGCFPTEVKPKYQTSKFYVRLPSNDEAMVAEMDEYFDGDACVKTLSDVSQKEKHTFSCSPQSPVNSCSCGGMKQQCPYCVRNRIADSSDFDAHHSLGVQSEDAGFVSMESDLLGDEGLDDRGARRSRHTSGEDRLLLRQISQTNAPARCR